MNYRIIFVFFVSIVIGNFNSFASDTTSIRVTSISKFDNDFSSVTNDIHVDTILQSFYHYELDGRNFMNSLGNPGLAYTNMGFKPLDFGFQFGDNAFLNNFDELKGNSVYYTTEPFARVSYRDGPKKYQDFDVLFSESFNKRLNFTVSFNTQSSTGYYSNQTTITKRFDFQNSFKTKSGRYGYFFKFKVRNGYATENGGIKSDSLYTELTQLGPLDTDNNKLRVLTWNENSLNTYDHRNLYVSQYFRLSESIQDSVKYKAVYFGMVNQGGFDDLWYKDSLLDSSYYQQFNIQVLDSGIIRDQSKLFYVQNEFFVKLTNYISLGDIYFGGKLNYYENENLIRSKEFNESSIYIRLSEMFLGKTQLTGLFEKGISGFNEYGYQATGDFKLPVNDSLYHLFIGGWIVKSLPEYKFINYGGTDVSWENTFDYSRSSGVRLKLEFPKIKVRFNGEYEINQGYVYYGKDVRPIQYTNSFYRYKLEVKKEVVLGKYHFDFSLINQEVEEGTPVNLSKWVGVISFYYQRLLFKEAMEVRYGIDYWQNSSYFAQSYAPFTRSFVYQDAYKVGDYPYLNFYISARIKGAQGFVNFQNIGQFVFKENYMMVPGYALQDFGLSFGLRWDFYN